MKRLAVIALLGLLSLPAMAQSLNGTRLTTAGPTIAGPVLLGPAQKLQVTVPLGGDQPTATYVFARFGNNQPLQRTNEGYWIPWTGDQDALIDNRFRPQGDSLTFKITDEDLSPAFLPVHFFVAYRVGTSFKYGSFSLVQP